MAKPSTASVSWLWNDVRRISPSVTTSRPAASCAATASSTASSSTRLNSAGDIVPAVEGVAGIKQRSRAQHAADDVGVGMGVHGGSVHGGTRRRKANGTAHPPCLREN